MNYKLHKTIITTIKKTFGIHSLKLFVRKKQLQVERLFYHKKYTAHELVDELVRMGMKPGSVVIVHCAMNNFYNYRGTVDELIDEERCVCLLSHTTSTTLTGCSMFGRKRRRQAYWQRRSANVLE